MLQASRIAPSLADHLLETTGPTANPMPLIEGAFRREFQVGLSIRTASRGFPTGALLYRKEARHGPC